LKDCCWEKRQNLLTAKEKLKIDEEHNQSSRDIIELATRAACAFALAFAIPSRGASLAACVAAILARESFFDNFRRIIDQDDREIWAAVKLLEECMKNPCDCV